MILRLMLLLVAVGAGPAMAQEATGILLRPDSIDLGTVEPKVDLEAEFEIVNQTEKPFVISRIERSCKCVTVLWDALTAVPPGASSKVKLLLRSDSRSGRHAILTITTSNRDLGPVLFHLFYAVIPEPTIEPLTLDFGTVPVGQPARIEVSVSYVLAGPQVPEPLSVFTDEPLPLAIEVGEIATETIGDRQTLVRFPVILTLDTTLPIDRFQKRLVLQGPQTRLLMVPLSGQVFDGWFVSPNVVNFGLVDAGTTRSKTFRVYYSVDKEPEIHKLRCSPDGLSAEYTILAAERCIEFTVTLTDAPEGLMRGQVVFGSNFFKGPTTVQVLSKAR